MMLGMQEIEAKRPQRGHRPVAEVEDARRLIREHQAQPGQAVNRPGGEPYDNEGQKLVHRTGCSISGRTGQSTGGGRGGIS